MSKGTPTALQSYRKANKERKVKILAKSGYKNEGGYLRSLGVTETSKKSPVKKATTKVTVNKLAKVAEVELSGDSELIGAFKAMSSTLL